MITTSYLISRWVCNRNSDKFEGLNGITGDVHRREPMEVSNKVILSILILPVVSSGIIGIGTSYARWDPIAIWGIKGYGIGIEGTIFAAEDWGLRSLPLGILRYLPTETPMNCRLLRGVPGQLLA